MTTITDKKNNGIYYTPSELANFAAKLGIAKVNSSILDPCYGDGALLLAAHKRLRQVGSISPARQIFGYDIAPPGKNLPRNKQNPLFHKGKLRKGTFFSAIKERRNKFDVILMNPPFVRHQLISSVKQKRLRNIVNSSSVLPGTSDLWVYFIIHSLKFIRKGGNLVAILPWSFLYADFAKCVRELLFEKFGTLHVAVLGKRMFERAEERILVVVGGNFGSSSTEVGVHYSFNVPKEEISWTTAQKKTWLGSPWLSLLNSDIQKVLSDLAKNLGFDSLGRFAKTRIGTVTGANNFFILERKAAKRIQLPRKILKPIITHTRDLHKLTIDASDDITHVIVLIPEDFELPQSLKRYIKMGKKKGLHKRYHTEKRLKWYSIPNQKPPDGFLHYMTKEVPFLVLNSNGLLSTNTVHQVEFLDEVDENTKKWIQFSMLTSISQVSAELVGRTYGGGVLKIEPTAAGKIMVYPGNGHSFPEGLRNKLNAYLVKGRRLDAVELADKWIIANLAVSKEDMDFVKECYQNIRGIRLGKNELRPEEGLRRHT